MCADECVSEWLNESTIEHSHYLISLILQQLEIYTLMTIWL